MARAPLAFVVHPETLRRLTSDALVVPLRPGVWSDSRHPRAERPENLIGPADAQAIEQETERIAAEWWRAATPDAFLWRDIHLSECFSQTLEMIVRDLLKTAAFVDRAWEKHRPGSVTTDAPALRHPFPPYPYFEAIGSVLRTRAIANGVPFDLLPVEVTPRKSRASGSTLVAAYVARASRMARAVLRKGSVLLAFGPYPESYGPVANARRGSSGSTVVLTTEHAPMRARPRSRLFVATLESFVESATRKEIESFVEHATAAVDGLDSSVIFGSRWQELGDLFRIYLRALLERELPVLAAAGVAFDREAGNATHLLLMETASPSSKAAVRYARRRGMPVTVIQHGIIAGAASYRRTEGDRIAAWGPADAAWFRANLIPPIRAEPTGSPRYDQLVLGPARRRDAFVERLSKDASVVMFASQPFVQDRASRSPWERQAAIEMVMEAAAQLSDAVLVVKWHPAETPESVPQGETKRGTIVSTNTADTIALVRRSAAVLAISSTVALEAMYLRRPVVFLGAADVSSPFHPPEDGGGVRAETEAELVDQVRRLLQEKSFRETVLGRQDAFLATHYAPLDGKAAVRVVDLVENR